MKFSTIVCTLALATFVNADAPACFGTCFTQAESSTNCDLNSDACLCADQGWLDVIGQCILDSGTCTGKDIDAATAVVVNACAAVGEPITVTTSTPANPQPTTSKTSTTPKSKPTPKPTPTSTPAPTTASAPTPTAPACFDTCFTQAESSTTCDLTSDACLCDDQGWLTAIGECVLDSGTCTGKDIDDSTAFIEAHCAAVNEPISVTTGTDPVTTPAPTGATACFATCFDQAENSSICSPSDDLCLCNDVNFITAIGYCILDSGTCTGSDIEDATQIVEEACAAVGITIVVSTVMPATSKPTFTNPTPSTTNSPTPTPTPSPSSPLSSGSTFPTLPTQGFGISVTTLLFAAVAAFIL